MIYYFKCPKCKKETEIIVPMSEKYTPECKCGEVMNEVYGVNVQPGCLDGGNVAC